MKVNNPNDNWQPKTRLFLLLTILFFTLLVQGQTKRLYGMVANQRDVEGIHILNTSSRSNSVTDANGEFLITVRPLDTLIVSSIAYIPEKFVVTKELYKAGFITITLKELVYELDEVYLGPKLSGNLERDIKKINVEDQINFDDVGIPGFKGKPEEKIVPIVPIIPLSVNLESLYKHLSGYYKKLKKKRKWETQNLVVSQMIYYYTPGFFKEAYQIPEERLYDFLLFCVENSEIQNNFQNENYNLVLETFSISGKEYNLRLNEKEE